MNTQRPSHTAPPASAHARGILVLTLTGVLAIGAAVGAQIWRKDLPVHGVRVEGNRIVPGTDLIRLAAVPMDKRLYDIDLRAVCERLRKNPFLKNVAVHRDPPDHVLIRVEERVPLAVIAAAHMCYLDAEGMLMPVIRSDNAFDLPVITGADDVQTCAVGTPLTHPAIREALVLVQAAQQLDEGLYRRISEVHIQPAGDLLMYTADAGVPVVMGRGDITSKLAKFDAFWSTVVSTRGAQHLASVDLRFADQVVVRWTTNDEQMTN